MRPAGLELLVGIMRDPLWDLVLTVGLGGIWTEVLQDTAVCLLPVSSADVASMLETLHGAALLRGIRGRTGVDIQALSEVIARIGALAQGLGPHLHTLEINPLLVLPERIEALDALLAWQA